MPLTAEECRSPVCDALIVKVPHRTTGTLHPIDWPATHDQPGPACTHEGSLAVRNRGQVWEYRVLAEGEQLRPDEHRAMSHFVTCPDSARFSSHGKCPQCGHARHPSGPCGKLGRITCRAVTTDHGTARLRGQWPCGCEHGIQPSEEVPADA